MHLASEPKQNTSVWLALRNRVFRGLWLASVVSGVCVSAHDTAATWLMNASGASPLLLSLMATAASLPFFLLTLPAGAVADLTNRRNLFIATYLWLAFAAGLLAAFAWLHLVHPYLILTTVFLLGTGFAFNAPVWASVVPEIVRREEIPSAVTLGGVQMNLAGIVGPALGSLLLPVVGPAVVFSFNIGVSRRGVGSFPSLLSSTTAGSSFGKLFRVVCQRIAICAVHARHASYIDA